MNETVIQLWFMPDRNRFMDNDGYIVWDMFRYISPSIYRIFLERKDYMCVETGHRTFVELFYPCNDEMDEFYY